MAGPLLQPLLLLLLSFVLGPPGPAAHVNGEEISKGVLCPKGSQPWQVALYKDDEVLCAGVLIDRSWVLTVADCHHSEYIVQMGSGVLSDTEIQRIGARETFVHPKFEITKQLHDIMLVKLSTPATLSSTVKTVDLPSQCKPAGTSCTVSAWGTTPVLEAARNPSQLVCTKATILPDEVCEKLSPELQRKYVLCAAPPDREGATCRGDSGSPLMCEGSLQGLVSTGLLPCPPPTTPSYYTRLCAYHQWISDTMKANP